MAKNLIKFNIPQLKPNSSITEVLDFIYIFRTSYRFKTFLTPSNQAKLNKVVAAENKLIPRLTPYLTDLELVLFYMWHLPQFSTDCLSYENFNLSDTGFAPNILANQLKFALASSSTSFTYLTESAIWVNFGLSSKFYAGSVLSRRSGRYLFDTSLSKFDEEIFPRKLGNGRVYYMPTIKKLEFRDIARVLNPRYRILPELSSQGSSALRFLYFFPKLFETYFPETKVSVDSRLSSFIEFFKPLIAILLFYLVSSYALEFSFRVAWPGEKVSLGSLLWASFVEQYLQCETWQDLLIKIRWKAIDLELIRDYYENLSLGKIWSDMESLLWGYYIVLKGGFVWYFNAIGTNYVGPWCLIPIDRRSPRYEDFLKNWF